MQKEWVCVNVRVRVQQYVCECECTSARTSATVRDRVSVKENERW